MRARRVQPVNRKRQRVGHVGRDGDDVPIRVGQRGERQQTAGGGFVVERARGAQRARRNILACQPVGQRKAERVTQERRQHDHLARRDALLMGEPRDLVRDPVEHLRVKLAAAIAESISDFGGERSEE